MDSLPDTAEMPELQAFLDEPTRYRASELIDAVLDTHSEDIASVPEPVKYIANRPSVEKICSHGLFSQTDEPINLEEVVDLVDERKGNVWNHIMSLKAEDAARLHYDNADAWKHLIRRNINELAEIHHMKPSDIQWYAAFHEKDHHPHIHLLVFSKTNDGYLSKKGMERMRSVFTNDIFRGEMYRMFSNQTELRNQLKREVNDLLEKTKREDDSQRGSSGQALSHLNESSSTSTIIPDSSAKSNTIDLILLNKDYEPLKVMKPALSEDSIDDDYEAYLREKYDDEDDEDFYDEEDYEEDIDEDEDQGWGQSM